MAEHTPGPWIWIDTEDEYALAGSPAEYVAYFKLPIENEANARLIAAAPDLLEALKALLDHCGHDTSVDPDGCPMCAAETVITKVEGGS